MRTKRVGALVVVDRKEKPIGILTDRDIVVRIVAQGHDPAEVDVGAVMRPDPTVIGEDRDLHEAIRVLRRRGVRCLP